MYWRNPIQENIEGIFALAIANDDEHEASTARKIAIRKLQQIEEDDLGKLSEILSHVARLDQSWPGALTKLQEIVDQASEDNPVLRSISEIKPPVPEPQAPTYEPTFEQAMNSMASRTVWEAHKEAAKEYSYDKYRHPWVHWQHARDEEDRDAGYEWFAEFEQASWADDLHEQSRTPPWRFWSQGIGPAEIFSLLQDLLKAEYYGAAIVGLSNLHWPPYEAIKQYALDVLSLEQLVTVAIPFLSAFELYDKYWLMDTLLHQKLCQSAPSSATTAALHRLVGVELGINDSCLDCRIMRTILGGLEAWNWQAPLEIIHDVFVRLEQTLQTNGTCEHECDSRLLEDVYDLTTHVNPVVAEASSAMLISLLADNAIDIRDVRDLVEIEPHAILVSPEWQRLIEAIRGMTDVVDHPSSWQNLWLPVNKYIKIVDLTPEPLPQLMPLLVEATEAIENAAEYRERHLYKDYASRSAVRRSWQPSDRDIQRAAMTVAKYAVPEDRQSIELIGRLVEAVLVGETATKDINVGAAILRALSNHPQHLADPVANRVFSCYEERVRHLDWLNTAYRPS